MIDYIEALRIAENYVQHLAEVANDDFQIILEDTKEVEKGWLFFFNTSEFIKSGNQLYALAGNGPFLVRRNADVCQLPSSPDWKEVLDIID
ncbi:YrhB domain-containing protein [Acidovorax sp. NCPPB 4044]|uniref:YrhB domain-containing protein n=1 Tax=Acidovorax sp. NCPPB 4044 TaxID=2940490 RepID=UPI002303D277|nr:YrhB domain-containing protein [Acidovorax sp. NCPPB 4044]MDA8523442.1 YrhB family protein [Acidovorax sp. NCPPB 4044]